jgi:hypothetical protein
MASNEIDSEAAVWIIDRGKKEADKIQKDLKAAALRVWPRAKAYGRRELHGTGLAQETGMISNAWEDALQSVEATLRKFRLGWIRNLDSYIFGTFAHRLRGVLSKENTIEYVPTNQELAKLKGAQDWDWVPDFEDMLELKRAVTQMDDWMKEVLFRRSQGGDRWRRIANDFGITEHQAKMRFSDRFKRLQEKILERKKPPA